MRDLLIFTGDDKVNLSFFEFRSRGHASTGFLLALNHRTYLPRCVLYYVALKAA